MQMKRDNEISNVCLAHLESQVINWDNLVTDTTQDCIQCEDICSRLLIPTNELNSDELLRRINSGYCDENYNVRFMREAHVAFLRRHLGTLGLHYMGQSSSKPWLYYYVLNSLDLLDAEPLEIYPKACECVDACRTAFGGYAGSHFEFPHTMTSYASVNTLIIMSAFSMIHRSELYRYFLSMKQSDGSFSVHIHGECDCRSTYCVLSTCRLLNMLTPEMTRDVGEYLLACQSYEGGFSGSPCAEAHGGYTWCAVAGLSILGRLGDCDVDGVEKWLYDRQCVLEGGYNGRTNKLVDGCYSWYVGASIAIVNEYKHKASAPLYDRKQLLQYIYCMEQDINGGMRDKPDMCSDLYHTMYCTCGLSLVEDVISNRVSSIHCMSETKVQSCISYFSSHSCNHEDLLNDEENEVLIEAIN